MGGYVMIGPSTCLTLLWNVQAYGYLDCMATFGRRLAIDSVVGRSNMKITISGLDLVLCVLMREA